MYNMTLFNDTNLNNNSLNNNNLDNSTESLRKSNLFDITIEFYIKKIELKFSYN